VPHLFEYYKVSRISTRVMSPLPAARILHDSAARTRRTAIARTPHARARRRSRRPARATGCCMRARAYRTGYAPDRTWTRGSRCEHIIDQRCLVLSWRRLCFMLPRLSLWTHGWPNWKPRWVFRFNSCLCAAAARARLGAPCTVYHHRASPAPRAYLALHRHG
jgi:hypothetical protein